MIYRDRGITGEKVSAIGVGGWHLGLPQLDERLSVRFVRTAIDRGINFLDGARAKEFCKKAAEFNSPPAINYAFIRRKATA